MKLPLKLSTVFNSLDLFIHRLIYRKIYNLFENYLYPNVLFFAYRDET